MSHAAPMAERWGGWYVTGGVGANDYLGNALLENDRMQEMPPLERAVPADLHARFPSGYLSRPITVTNVTRRIARDR